VNIPRFLYLYTYLCTGFCRIRAAFLLRSKIGFEEMKNS
jgi:hypothetical protein